MADLFGVRLVAATLARMSRSCAERFSGFAEAVCERVKAAPVKHLDGPSGNAGGDKPAFGQDAMAAHRVHRVAYLLSRLAPARQPAVVGIVVHDHWKPYYTMEGVLHALCNAHHLRELQALVDIEKEEWARRMQRLLRRACHATHLARGVPLDPRLVNQFRRRYDIIVTEGLAFHQDQPPLATPATNGKRRGPRRTISFCVSAPARTTCCASWTIPPCPSPTIRPSATGA